MRHRIARRAILGMHTLLEVAVGNLTFGRELKELTNFVRDPEPSRGDIKFPGSELRRIGSKRDAFLEFAQARLTASQAARERPCVQYIVAQLVRHRRYEALIK